MQKGYSRDRYYEVRGYDSVEGYNAGNYLKYSDLTAEPTRKRDAMRFAKQDLKKYPIVRVQSIPDYDFIEVLTWKGVNV